MKRTVTVAAAALCLACLPWGVSAQDDGRSHLFVCRTPVLAFDFWEALENIRRQGTKLTPKIAQDVCDSMRAGQEPQCLKIEAFKFKTLSTAENGAIAIKAGNTKTWFRKPDSRGWVHPDYWAVFQKSNAI